MHYTCKSLTLAVWGRRVAKGEFGSKCSAEAFNPRLCRCKIVYSATLFKTSRGGSRIFFRAGCTHLLLYFNTNKPHSFLFLQNTSCIRKPQVISGEGVVRTPSILPLDLPLTRDLKFLVPQKLTPYSQPSFSLSIASESKMTPCSRSRGAPGSRCKKVKLYTLFSKTPGHDLVYYMRAQHRHEPIRTSRNVT